MKLSLAVFCLINNVFGACDFGTLQSDITLHENSKGSTADFTVTQPDSNTVRITHTSDTDIWLQLPMKIQRSDRSKLVCDFKNLYMLDNDSYIGWTPKLNAEKNSKIALTPSYKRTGVVKGKITVAGI